LQPNDRVAVFFTGHGATRKLSSGRDRGYIVPFDAAPNNLATDPIPMTEIQNIAESLPAKHALFVTDACYSGLGLTRGAAKASFLRDNARRLDQQMLTAGGTDQLVADGGPNAARCAGIEGNGRGRSRGRGRGQGSARRPDAAQGACGGAGVKPAAAAESQGGVHHVS
jgi:uncharacterized caspase-like protein